jgi:hypothetical protein
LKPSASALLTAGFVAGCAAPSAPAGSIDPEPDGDHRVLGVGCDFFSTASSTRAHALREADSFRVRPMAAADLGELLQLVDERAFSALFSDCKR